MKSNAEQAAREAGYRVVTFKDDPGKFYWKTRQAVAFTGEDTRQKAWEAACRDAEIGEADTAPPASTASGEAGNRASGDFGERWSPVSGLSSRWIENATGERVITLPLALTDGQSRSEWRTLERIAACVNACDGIPTAALEKIGAIKGNAARRVALSELAAQLYVMLGDG